PDGDREHAAEPLPEARAPLLVAVDEHLGVAPRPEAVAGALELVHQLAVVVDLAVLDDDDAAVLVRDWLVAPGQVDDRGPSRRDPDQLVDVHALRVRPPVVERLRHAAEPIRVDRATCGRDPADPAHGAAGYSGGTAAERLGDDPERGDDDRAQVEPHRAVGDPFEVVGEL